LQFISKFAHLSYSIKNVYPFILIYDEVFIDLTRQTCKSVYWICNSLTGCDWGGEAV